MSVGVYFTPEVKDSVELDDEQEEVEEIENKNIQRFSEIISKLK